MTVSTFGCQVATSANDSSTTQSKRMSGMARAASVSAGKVWTKSPIDERRTIKTRIISAERLISVERLIAVREQLFEMLQTRREVVAQLMTLERGFIADVVQLQ